MALRLSTIVLVLLTLMSPLLAAREGQARPVATPQATAAANPGPPHLQVTQLTVGTALPIEGHSPISGSSVPMELCSSSGG